MTIYPASSGNRTYKAAFVTKDDYSRITGSAAGTNGSGSTADMSYALYQTSGGKISCGFDGYVNTKGRHEGIDFVKGLDSKVYSLTDGEITRITFGKEGSDGLSTIAVYCASEDKTVVYLHTAPLSTLKEGQTVSKGQQIATESWRGVSSSKSAHTHVEVRDGKKTSAAKSVNDSKLDNSDPTSFWKGQGYTVK